jgi:hypothetical protein
MGVNYVFFSKSEKNIFSFLFMNKNFDMTLNPIANVDDEVIKRIKKDVYVQKYSIENYNEIFFNLWVFAHGLASLIYNSEEPYDKKKIRAILSNTSEIIFKGISPKRI